MTIILRTLCGCERQIAIPDRYPPSTFSVPFLRTPSYHIFPADGDTAAMDHPIGFEQRVFERTPVRGLYGYRVYLERRGAAKEGVR